MDDEQIIELYWQRSETAISSTELKYGRYCRHIAHNILSNDEDSEECVNDAYLNTWNAIPPRRPTILSAFLGKITRNLALNRYQQVKALKRGGGEVEILLSELEDCIPTPENMERQWEAEEISQSISSFLRTLDERTRHIFIRRYWYADALSNICTRYGLSLSAVKSTLFRTRNRLKAHLEQEGIFL